MNTPERWIDERENLERIRLVGPYDEGTVTLRWLSENGYRTIRSGPYTDKKMYPKVDMTRFLFMAERPVPNGQPKGKSGFHVISLKGSEKLRRLHQVLLDAKGKKLSSLELTHRTRLVAISTWLNHLKKPPNNIPVLNEQRTENGQQIWYWWIEKA